MKILFIPKKQTMLSASSILLVDASNPAKVYLYDHDTNISTLLSIPGITGLSSDIAHTANKLWLYTSGGIGEWNITFNPFTAVFNRSITGVYPTAGLGAKNDTKIISGAYLEYDITTILATISATFSSGMAGRHIAGDIILTTNNKVIVTFTKDDYTQSWISQFSYPDGALELDIDITAQCPSPYGIYQYNDQIFIAQPDGSIYNIDIHSPYNLTLINMASHSINGASQIPSFLTTSLIP